MNYLGINLTTCIVYAENYKMLMKDQIRSKMWRNIWCSLIVRFNIIKMSIPIKIPAEFFVGIYKLVSIFIWKGQRASQKIYCKAIAIKTVRYWKKNSNIDQWTE